MHLDYRAVNEEEYARKIERLNRNVEYSAEIGLVNISQFILCSCFELHLFFSYQYVFKKSSGPSATID